jgi:hypothetical protein
MKGGGKDTPPMEIIASAPAQMARPPLPRIGLCQLAVEAERTDPDISGMRERRAARGPWARNAFGIAACAPTSSTGRNCVLRSRP